MVPDEMQGYSRLDECHHEPKTGYDRHTLNDLNFLIVFSIMGGETSTRTPSEKYLREKGLNPPLTVEDYEGVRQGWLYIMDACGVSGAFGIIANYLKGMCSKEVLYLVPILLILSTTDACLRYKTGRGIIERVYDRFPKFL